MSTFDSTKNRLADLLRNIVDGKTQLPDFQRGWVWDDEHIRSLLTSIARAFPVGAVMLLETGGDAKFKIRPVTDGDTVTLLDSSNQQHKIRLAGIDAPESHQPFGQKSKTSLSALLFNSEALADCSKRDKYGRLVCKVLVNGTDANLEQVKAGMAWHYKKYAKDQPPKDREDYEIAEFNAKMRRLGLWADKNPVPPWEWRLR